MTVSLSTSATAVQPSVTSTGIGSGLDINSLVTSMVTATIQPQQTLLQNKQTSDQATISALGSIQSALSSLQSAVDAIDTGGALSQLTAQSGNSSAFTATVGSGAVPGSYQVQVTQLAQANTIGSSAFASATTAVGAGSYTISTGSSSFTVTMNASNTLADLRDAINSSSSSSGVSATIVNGSDGAHLLLSSTQTGVANAVSMTPPSGSTMSFSTIRAATDAQVSIAGYTYTSSSNIVSGALDGVTLNLAQAQPGTDISLTVGADQQAASTALQTFVSAYNAALNLINQSTAYTPSSSSSSSSSSSGTSGPLLGDLTVQRLSQQLQSIVGTGVQGTSSSGGFSLLSQIGISENSDGTLSVDTTKLGNALQQNPKGVQSLFAGTGGVGTQLDNMITVYVGAGGVLRSEVAGVQSQLDDVTNQLSNLTQKQNDLQARYLAQFNAMDTVVGNYKSIASYLTTYSNSLNNVSSSSSKS